MMNYPIWTDSAGGYSRTLLGNSGMRSLPPPPPPPPDEKCPPKYNGDRSRLNEDCGSGSARGHQIPSDNKYAPLSSFPDDDSLLKVATHFLSGGNGQGRHYMPIARDYSALGYSSGTYCQQQQPQQAPLERPVRHQTSDGGPSRISSASSTDNGAQPNPLLSPCSVMEEASSPGSTTSQLSYLGALQSPATSLTPLGFPTPAYLLTKDGGVAAAAAHAAQGHSSGHVVVPAAATTTKQKKEPKPGSDVRSFGCQVCGRGFKQKATLAQHERTHTDERPFDCPDCHKRFRQQSHLVQHLRIHSDERPYGCTYCEKAFRQKAILNQHIRIHTGEKPYVCPQCTKCFRQKAILNQHIRTHSGKRPYSCPDAKCKKKFVDQVSMEKHFKKHIEDDQQQLLAEARGGPVRRNNAKGLLRVKLNSSDRPASFSRVIAPGAGGVSTQDRATSPFPINMMVRAPTAPAGSPERVVETPRIELDPQQAPPTYLTHHHHQATSAGPYQFVPFPHRPYHYDLLSLGSMGQSMYGGGNNKMTDHSKYRSDTLGESSQAPHNQMGGEMEKDCGGNNNMATNYTVNGGVKNDSVP